MSSSKYYRQNNSINLETPKIRHNAISLTRARSNVASITWRIWIFLCFLNTRDHEPHSFQEVVATILREAWGESNSVERRQYGSGFLFVQGVVY